LAIGVTCPSCNVKLRFKNEHAGKTAKCRACDAPVLVQGETLPDRDVFISYSSRDKNVANAIVATLEAKKLRCWIAPRDILPGKQWAGAILDGISDTRVMVLIFSKNSNTSPQVLREVDRAVSRGVVIIPFRIENTVMSKEMEYYISAAHWLDAIDGPMEANVERLAETIKRLLTPVGGEVAPAAAVVSGTPLPPKRKSAARTMAWAVLLAVVAGLGVYGVTKAMRTNGDKGPAPVQAPLPDSGSPDMTVSVDETAVRPVMAAGNGPMFLSGDWKADGAQLVQTKAMKQWAVVVFGDPSWSSYDFTFSTKGEGAQAVAGAFHWGALTDHYQLVLSGDPKQGCALNFMASGKRDAHPGMNRKTQAVTNRWYDVRIEVRGSDFRCFVDGTLLFTDHHPGFSKGRVALAAMGPARFRDIKVSSPDGKMLWDGLPQPPAEGPVLASDAGPGTINLLPMVQLPGDALMGVWERTAQGYYQVGSGGLKDAAKLRLPYKPSGEYDLRVLVSRTEGIGAVGLIMTYGGHEFGWFMGNHVNGECGFALVDGKPWPSNRSTVHHAGMRIDAKSYTILVKVRKDSVSAYLDGELIDDFKTSYSDLSLRPMHSMGDGMLGIWTASSIIIRSADLFPVAPGPATRGK
jgi:hypothetical protein